MMFAVLWGIFAAVNLITFVLYGVDKRRAKANAWRIQERTLLLFTWMLGGLGACLGMRIFRHKTKHLVFTISAPLALAVSILLMAAATKQLIK